jgi:hypothetical protein
VTLKSYLTDSVATASGAAVSLLPTDSSRRGSQNADENVNDGNNRLIVLSDAPSVPTSVANSVSLQLSASEQSFHSTNADQSQSFFDDEDGEMESEENATQVRRLQM